MPHRMPPPAVDFQRRLSRTKADLGISEAQQPAWDAFVKTYGAVAVVLEGFENEAAECSCEYLPSFPNALDLEIRSLAARLAAARMIKAITHSLYRVLSSRQRERADRLLPALGRVVVGQGPSAHIQPDRQRQVSEPCSYDVRRKAKLAA